MKPRNGVKSKFKNITSKCSNFTRKSHCMNVNSVIERLSNRV